MPDLRDIELGIGGEASPAATGCRAHTRQATILQSIRLCFGSRPKSPASSHPVKSWMKLQSLSLTRHFSFGEGFVLATWGEQQAIQRREECDTNVVTSVEAHPNGYPRFSALMASHEPYLIFRRFSHVRTRLLLLAQDNVVQLEQKLRELDLGEGRPLYLGCSRMDQNEERLKVLSELRQGLAEYGTIPKPIHPFTSISLVTP